MITKSAAILAVSLILTAIGAGTMMAQEQSGPRTPGCNPPPCAIDTGSAEKPSDG